MKHWTNHHRALSNALVAEEFVPKLYRRLSLERLDAGADDARRLRDWIVSLRADSGWRLMEPKVDQPSAWPEVWRRATEAGFSARTDHHHALLFERICTRLVAEHDLEVARFAWEECVGAWLRVFEGDYVDALLDELGAGDDEHRRRLLRPLAERREEEIFDALRLEEGPAASTFDRRRTRFGWRALSHLVARIDDVEAPHPALAALAERAREARKRVVQRVVERFEAGVESVDPTDGEPQATSRPFEWIREVFTILAIEPDVAARVVSAAVDVGWKLRKLEVDDADELTAHLLALARPFNDRLESALLEGETFGHNAACADFFVFEGERHKRTSERRNYFERALAACPGHRNASMMLSYEKLREMSGLLMRVRYAPSAIRMLPGASKRVDSTVRQAASLLDDAEELYPANEEIPEYRQRLEDAARRLGAEIHE